MAFSPLLVEQQQTQLHKNWGYCCLITMATSNNVDSAASMVGLCCFGLSSWFVVSYNYNKRQASRAKVQSALDTVSQPKFIHHGNIICKTSLIAHCYAIWNIHLVAVVCRRIVAMCPDARYSWWQRVVLWHLWFRQREKGSNHKRRRSS